MDVKDVISLIEKQTIDKACSAIAMKHKYPEQGEFWQGQYQAFSEMETMLSNMKKNL